MEVQNPPKKFLGIGKKLLFWILLSSSILTSILTSIQFYFDYTEESQNLRNTFRQVEMGSLDTISAQIWQLDTEGLNINAESIMRYNDVIYINIVDHNGGELVSKGNPEESHYLMYTKTFPLVYKLKKTTESVGKLTLSISKKSIYTRLFKKAILFFMSQAVKTLVTSLVILYIVNLLIVKHIEKAVDFFKTYNHSTRDKNKRLLKFSRTEKNTFDDEFNFLEASINKMSLENMNFLHNAKQQQKSAFEIEASQSIQQALYHPKIDVPMARIHSHVIEKNNSLGGDIYDQSFDEKNKVLYYYIGEVSGKNFASALLSGIASGCLFGLDSYTSKIEHDIALDQKLIQMMKTTNEIIVKTQKKQRGMSLLLCALKLETGELYYVNAGHCNPTLLNDGLIFEGESAHIGPKLGVSEDSIFSCQKKQLSEGDFMFLHSYSLVKNSVLSKHPKLFEEIQKTLAVNSHDSSEAHESLKSFLSQELDGNTCEESCNIVTLLVCWIGNESTKIADVHKIKAAS